MSCDFAKCDPWISRAIVRIGFQSEFVPSLPCSFFVRELSHHRVDECGVHPRLSGYLHERALQVSSCDSTLRDSGTADAGLKKNASSGPGSRPNFSGTNRFCYVIVSAVMSSMGMALLRVRFWCELAKGILLSCSPPHGSYPPMFLPSSRPACVS